MKKACLADGLAPLVDAYFAAPASYDAASAWAAMLCYAVQIYCDFSGYTDMAIAIARSLGYELTPNFAFPYLSRNVAEFWRRWHISLSTWLRDYLYISLGGNRGSRLFTARNLMLTMLLGGLWHGAAWTFVAWGALHGLALVVHREWSRRAPAPRPSLRLFATALTFAFVVLAWVPFRASDVYVDAKNGKPLRALADGFYPERAERTRHPRAALERDLHTGDWHTAGDPSAVRVHRVTGGFGTTAVVWRAMLVPGGAGERTLARPALWGLLLRAGAAARRQRAPRVRHVVAARSRTGAMRRSSARRRRWRCSSSPSRIGRSSTSSSETSSSSLSGASSEGRSRRALDDEGSRLASSSASAVGSLAGSL